MRGLRPVLLGTVVAAAIALPVTSPAGHQEVTDRNDARGPLDVHTVRIGSERPVAWTVTTWGSWTATKIWDRGYMTIKFDTMRDSHFDYYALVRSNGRRLLGTLHRDYTRKRDSEIAVLRVRRPGKTSLKVRIPYGEMRFAEPDTYRWTVTASWTAKRCPSVCLDRVPNSGAIVEPGPGPTVIPTPKITLTPTTSPSSSPSPSSPSPSPSSR